MPHLLCFGFGFSARAVAPRLAAEGWRITGTSRTHEGAAAVQGHGYEALVFDGSQPIAALPDDVTHILVSVPATATGEAADPVLAQASDAIAALPALGWIGYLSTVGVYGDHQGAWIDETTPVNPGSDRSKRRVAAENGWLALGASLSVPVQVFRLAGIYGPGRSQVDSVRAGKAKRVDKPGQVFNRIHVDDIATTVIAGLARPHAGPVFNLADDEPAPPQDVTAFAAELLGVDPPPLVPFDEAEMSPMGRSFYAEVKRVRNERIKGELGVTLAHPTYREGLRAVLAATGGD